MRKNVRCILSLICIAAVLSACENDANEDDKSVSSEYTLMFDRETFELERQLWLEQDIQDYSFYQKYWDTLGPRDSDVYVQSGIALFARERLWDSQSGYYSRTAYPDNTSNAFFADIGKSVIISISDIYAEIARWANEDDTHRIEVQYHKALHYPTAVVIGRRIPGRPPINALGHLELYSNTVYISNFVIDPEIPEPPPSGG